MIHVGLVLEHFSQILILVYQHFELVLHLLVVLMVVASVVEFFDGFRQLGIDPDKLFKGLLEDAVLLFQLLVAFLELFILALTGEVVFESIVLTHQLEYKIK